MQSYDEVTNKYNKFLTGAQKKQLRQRANALSLQNAATRNQLQSAAVQQTNRSNEMLSSYGIAANLRTAPSSGPDELSRRQPQFRQQLQGLAAQEQGLLNQTGLQMANATINARIAEAQKAARGATSYRVIDPETGHYLMDSNGQVKTYSSQEDAQKVQTYLNTASVEQAPGKGQVTAVRGTGDNAKVAALIAQQNALNAERNVLVNAANMALANKDVRKEDAAAYAASRLVGVQKYDQAMEEVEKKYRAHMEEQFRNAFSQATKDGVIPASAQAMMNHMVRTGRISYDYAAELLNKGYLRKATYSTVQNVNNAERAGLLSAEEANTARTKLRNFENGALNVNDLIATRYDDNVNASVREALGNAVNAGLISEMESASYSGKLAGLTGNALADAANSIFGALDEKNEERKAEHDAAALSTIETMVNAGVISAADAVLYRANLSTGAMSAAAVVGVLTERYRAGVAGNAESAIDEGIREGVLTEEEAAVLREQVQGADAAGVADEANRVIDMLNERYSDKVMHEALNTLYSEFYNGDVDTYLSNKYGMSWEEYSEYARLSDEELASVKAEAEKTASEQAGTTAGEAAKETVETIKAVENEKARIDYYSMGDTYYKTTYGMTKQEFDSYYAMDEATLKMLLDANENVLAAYDEMAAISMEDKRQDEVLDMYDRMNADLRAQTEALINGTTEEEPKEEAGPRYIRTEDGRYGVEGAPHTFPENTRQGKEFKRLFEEQEEAEKANAGGPAKKFGRGRDRTVAGVTEAPAGVPERTREVTVKPINGDTDRGRDGMTDEGRQDRETKMADNEKIRTILAIKSTEQSAEERAKAENQAKLVDSFVQYYTHEAWTPEKLNAEADRLRSEERVMKRHLGELREKAMTSTAAMAEYNDMQRSLEVNNARRAAVEQKLVSAPLEQAARWGEVKELPEYREVSERGALMADAKDASDLTKLINGKTEERGLVASALTPSWRKSMEETVRLMNDEERTTYNYYLAKNGEEGAKEYFDALRPELNRRRMENISAAANTEWTGNWLADGILKTSLRIGSVAFNWMGEVAVAGLKMAGKELDANDPVFALETAREGWTSSTKTGIHDAIMQDTELWDTDYKKRARWAAVVSFGYDCTISCAENLVMRTIGMGLGDASAAGKSAEQIGEMFTLFSMSCSSALSTQRQYLARGASQNQAMEIGILAGICESLFEKVSLDNLVNMPKQQMKSWLVQTLTQAGIEGSEEGATELANMFCNVLVFGNRNDYERAVEQKVQNGMSEKAARSEAFIEQLEDIGMAMVGGAFSGALMGGVESWKNKIRLANAGAQLTNAEIRTLLDEAAQIPNEDVQKIRQRVENAFIDNGRASNLSIGMLNYAVQIAGLDSVNATIDTMVEEGAIELKDAQDLKEAYEQNAMLQGFGGDVGLANLWEDVNDETLAKVSARLNAENKLSGREYDDFFAEKKRAAEADPKRLMELSDRINAREQQKKPEFATESGTKPMLNPFASPEAALQFRADQDRMNRASFAKQPVAVNVNQAVNADAVTAGVQRRFDDRNGVAVNLHEYRTMSQLSAQENLMLRFSQAIARATGLQIEVHDRLNTENGFYRGDDGTLHIALNAESFTGAMAHELTHFIKAKTDAEAWSAFTAYFKKNATAFEQLVAKKRAEYAKEISGKSEQAARAYAEEEAIASLCEDMLNDETKVYEFCRENETLAQRILSVLDNVLRNFKQLIKGAKEGAQVWRLGNDVEKVREMRDMWYDMLQKASDAQKSGVENGGETMHSLMEFEDGLRFVEIDQNQDLFDNADIGDYPKIVQRLITDKFKGKVVGIDNRTFVNRKTAEEYGHPAKRLDNDLFESKSRTAGELDNIVDAATNKRIVQDGESGHTHENVDSFEHSDVIYKIGKRFFEGRLNVQLNGTKRLFKDVTKIKDVTNSIVASYGIDPKYYPVRTSSMSESIGDESNSVKPETMSSKRSEAADERSAVAAEMHKSIFDIDRGHSALDYAKSMTERSETLDEDGNGTGNMQVNADIEDIAMNVRAVPNFGMKDPAKMLDALAGKNTELRGKLKELIEDPFNEAGGKYAHQLKERREAFDSEMKRLGIIGDDKSKASVKQYKHNSALVQAYGEGTMTLEELRSVAPNWENIVKAAEVCRNIYDDYVVELNTMLENVYPNVIEHWETRKDKLQGYVEYEQERASNQRAYIKELQDGIATMRGQLKLAEEGKLNQRSIDYEPAVAALNERIADAEGRIEVLQAMIAKSRPGTKVRAGYEKSLNRARAQLSAAQSQLESINSGAEDAKTIRNRIAFEEQKVETAKLMLEKYEQKAALRILQKQQIEQGMATGDLVRNRKVLKRNNYFHHFNENEGANTLAGLKNALFGESEISPDLVGKTDQTKPKSKWAGFMQQRRGGTYTLDAVEGMHRYMEDAERKLAFDPLTAHLQELETQITEAQMNNGVTNANSMERWLQEWRNSIVGKSNKLDRAIHDSGMGGRKFIKVLKWINSRGKSNTILGNFHSAAVQVSNITNASSYIKDVKAWANAARQMISMKFGSAQDMQTVKAALEQSAYMTQRYGLEFENYDESWSPKQFALWMMGAGDELAGKYMWLAAYNSYLNDPSIGDKVGAGQYRDAVEFADDITRRSTAGRGIGEQPTMLTSAVVNTLAPFQLEVNNSWQLFKENVQKKNVTGLAAFEVVTYLMNGAFEAAFGDRPLPFDFIDAVVSALTADDDDDDDDEKEVSVIGRLLQNVGGQFAASIPFSGLVLEKLVGTDMAEKMFGEKSPTLYGTSILGFGQLSDSAGQIIDFIRNAAGGKLDSLDKVWTKLLDDSDFMKLVLPWGGAQAQRTLKGIDTMVRGYSQKMNKKGELEAQFAVDRTNPFKWLGTAMFGKWSTEEGKAYLEGKTKKLSAEQTAAMKESGMAPEKFFMKMAEFRSIAPEKDADGNTIVSATTLKLKNLLEDKSLTEEQKNLMMKTAVGNKMVERWLEMDPEKRVCSTDDFLRYATMYGETIANDADGSKAAQFVKTIGNDSKIDGLQRAELAALVLGTESSMAKKLAAAAEKGAEMVDHVVYYTNVANGYKLDGDSKTGKDDVLTDMLNDNALTAEQKREVERIMYDTEEDKLHDYTSAAAFEVSGNKSQKEKLEQARTQGFTDEQFMKYYNKKGDALWQSLMLDSSMTAAQKGAMQQIVLGKDSARDFTSVARYELSGMSADKYGKALSCISGGIPDTTVLRYAKMDKQEARDALLTDRTLTNEQKSFVEQTMFSVDEEKTRDYSSKAWYELSANDTRYKLAKHAEKSGVTPETALRYFELKATKEPNDIGIDTAIAKNEVREAVLLDNSLTLKQKQAIDEMLYPNDKKRPDYTNKDWYYISTVSDAQYKKAQIAKAHGISEAVFAAEMREYYRMKDAKLGTGKNGAMKDRDTDAIIAKLGISKADQKVLKGIIKNKITA